MTNYTKEAERLSRVLEDIAQTALRGVENEQIRGHLMDAAALLAHIQRGAVPDGIIGWLVGNEEGDGEFINNQSALDGRHYKGGAPVPLAAAPAPDQFRDAAKMMAEPAEVPMPEPDATLLDSGHYAARRPIVSSYEFNRAGWRLDVISLEKARTYGIACRDAGYARGLRDAVRDAVLLIQNGEVLVTVTGLTGSGKSAIAGEIEIMCRALGLDVEWVGGDAEKRLTHADWTDALEMYRPRVRIIEANISQTDAALRGEVK